MYESSSGKVVLIQVHVSDPAETNEPGRYKTILTHPSLTGQLELIHGEDREALLNAVAADIKSFDPVSSLFRNLVEWRKSV